MQSSRFAASVGMGSKPSSERFAQGCWTSVLYPVFTGYLMTGGEHWRSYMAIKLEAYIAPMSVLSLASASKRDRHCAEPLRRETPSPPRLADRRLRGGHRLPQQLP